MRNPSPAPDSARRGWSLVKPSLADLFFPVLLLAAFARLQSWQALLADGDTGWHIRTGDFILQTRTVPLHDFFSFSRPGQPWFAWEWLSDVVFALLYRWRGLEAVAAFSAVVLCLSAVCLLRWLLRRGAGLWIALPVALAAVSASSIHYLARPHIFSLLFVTLTLWLLDEDRRRRGPLVWILVPAAALWANFHGGFVCGLAILGLLAAVCALERNRPDFQRYASLAALCSAATLLNPYGWHLHQHILAYLRSSWILDNVQEFQSPRIRAENMQVFAVLLLFGVALVSRAFARRQWFEGLLVLAWAFAALRSARHVPLYAVAAAPLIAQELAAWWSRSARRLPARSAVRTGIGGLVVPIGPALARTLRRPHPLGAVPGIRQVAAHRSLDSRAGRPGLVDGASPAGTGGLSPSHISRRGRGAESRPASPPGRHASHPDLRSMGRLSDFSPLSAAARVLRRAQRFLRPRGRHGLPVAALGGARMAPGAGTLPLRDRAPAARLAARRGARE
ncbi:membrane hypothetical protein [Candidatus Sulfopaludibacter sp. SbA4]|nr:membrane hypothetical protein [Candidatus Sulfopaludibacter sp. SbA4]